MVVENPDEEKNVSMVQLLTNKVTEKLTLDREAKFKCQHC